MGDSVTACCKSNNARVPFPSAGHQHPHPQHRNHSSLYLFNLSTGCLTSHSSRMLQRVNADLALATQPDEVLYCPEEPQDYSWPPGLNNSCCAMETVNVP